MARRERTTGLPRPRPKASSASGRRIGGLTLGDHQVRLAIIGTAVLALLAIIAGFAYNIYEEQVGRPGTVILTVGDDDVTLGYYADRLLGFLQENANSGESAQLAEEALLNKLEEEALTLQVARDRGIKLSPQDVTQAIADSFGVPAGPSGSSYDTLYRNQLKQLSISDSNYRKLREAQLANGRLIEAFTTEVGASGEQLVLRIVIVNSKEAADAILKRVQDGEDLGTVAQLESIDLESRQRDGVMLPEPLALLPESLRTAVEGKGAGELLGPVQVEANWWVFRVDKREDTPYTAGQKAQLAQMKLDEAIKAKRAQLGSKVQRSLDADDIKWAERHLD
jgi:parvulin-like peptidyl-prolyl isomerase